MASVSSFSKGNITYIDDALIKAAIFVLCCASAVLIAYFRVDRTGAGLLMIWFTGIAGVGLFLLVAGLIARKREKQCVGLWRLLQTHPEIKLSQYLQQSGNSLSDVQRGAKAINNAGAGLLVVDTINDRLYDSRLSENESIVFQCANCGASSQTSTSGFAVVCQYCQAPAHADAMTSVAGKHDALIKSNLERMSLLSQAEQGHHHGENSEMDIRILLVLLVLFWPAALGYFIWKNKSMLQQSPERLKSLLDNLQRK